MKIVDDNFELQGMPCSRTLKDFLFWKLLPVGNLAEGPGIVWLLSAMFRHKLGYRIAKMQSENSPVSRRFVSIANKFRSRGSTN